MSNKPKIIFINRFFFPDHSATSQMLSDLAFALVRNGWKVQVITSRLRYDDPGENLPASEKVRGVEIKRVWSSRFGRRNLAGRAVDYASFYVTMAYHLLRSATRGDIVVAKTDPPLLALFAVPIARLIGAKPVNWLQDVFPEVAEASGFSGRRLRRFLFAALRKLRDRSLKAARCNVAIGNRMAARLTARGVEPTAIRVIPNWSHSELMQPVPRAENRLRREWQLGDKFVVSYSGNLGRAHEIETILAAMALMGSSEGAQAASSALAGEIVWLFIGGGALMEELKSEVEKRQYSNVLFKPYQPREDLAATISIGDVHLVSLRPQLEGLIVPSKYYGIAAIGRPVIFVGDVDGEIAEILAGNGGGMTVPPGNGKALLEAIRHYKSQRGENDCAGQIVRATFMKHHDFPVLFEEWQGLFMALAGEGGDKASRRGGELDAPPSVARRDTGP